MPFSSLDSSFLQALARCFRGYDVNNNGIIESGECDVLLDDYFPGLDPVVKAEIRKTLMIEAGGNPEVDGKLDITELVAFIAELQYQQNQQKISPARSSADRGGSTEKIVTGKVSKENSATRDTDAERDRNLPTPAAAAIANPEAVSDVDVTHLELINSIMQNMAADEIDILRDAFIYMDLDSDGFISLSEMLQVVRSVVGDKQQYEALSEYLRPIFVVADKDKDGKLSLTEFLASFADGPGVVPNDVINACVSSIRIRLTDEEIYALQESFRRIDRNCDGFIDRDELLVALKEVLLVKFPDLSDKTFNDIVNVIMASADADRDNKLSLSEFIRSFQEDQGVLPAAFIDVRASHVARHLSRDEVAQLKEAFAAIDRDHDGFVDYIDMYQVLWEALRRSLGDDNKSRAKELCDLIMATADRNKDGKLTLTDFIRNFVQNTEIMSFPVAAAQGRILETSKRLKELIGSDDLGRIIHVFRHLDCDNDGFLERKDLEGVLGGMLTEEFPDFDHEVIKCIIDAIITNADVDRDGKLSINDFIISFLEGHGVLPASLVRDIDEGCAKEDLQRFSGSTEGTLPPRRFLSSSPSSPSKVTRECSRGNGAATDIDEGGAIGYKNNYPEGREMTERAGKLGGNCGKELKKDGAPGASVFFGLPENEVIAIDKAYQLVRKRPGPSASASASASSVVNVMEFTDAIEDKMINESEGSIHTERVAVLVTTISHALNALAGENGEADVGRFMRDIRKGLGDSATIRLDLLVPSSEPTGPDIISGGSSSSGGSTIVSGEQALDTESPLTPATPLSSPVGGQLPPARPKCPVASALVSDSPIPASATETYPTVTKENAKTERQVAAALLLQQQQQQQQQWSSQDYEYQNAKYRPQEEVTRRQQQMVHNGPSSSQNKNNAASSVDICVATAAGGTGSGVKMADISAFPINDVSESPISEAQLRREFAKYDRDNNGYLDREEFKNVYLSLENYGLPPSRFEIDKLFNKYDTKRDNRLGFEEFCVLMLHRSRM